MWTVCIWVYKPVPTELWVCLCVCACAHMHTCTWVPKCVCKGQRSMLGTFLNYLPPYFWESLSLNLELPDLGEVGQPASCRDTPVSTPRPQHWHHRYIPPYLALRGCWGLKSGPQAWEQALCLLSHAFKQPWSPLLEWPQIYTVQGLCLFLIVLSLWLNLDLSGDKCFINMTAVLLHKLYQHSAIENELKNKNVEI